jgi:hypothetical protein
MVRGYLVLAGLIYICCMGSRVLYPVESGKKPLREYKIKAGFIYRFLFFADWPGNHAANPKGSAGHEIIIGILGDDPFGDLFNIVEGEKIGGQKLVVRRFEADARPAELVKCRILFISPGLEPRIDGILASLEGYPVLTVSEIKGFGQKGGIINFLTYENKVRFEINRQAAKRVGIKLSSKLLRLAVRIIGDKDENRGTARNK